MHVCEYGCGQEATHQFKNGKWCCSKSSNSCPQMKEINRNLNKGRSPWIKGKKLSEESRRKISKANKGKIVTEENRKKLSLSLKGKFLGYNNPMFGRHHSEESKQKMRDKKENFIPWNKGKKGLQHHSEKEKERCRQYMLNGHSKYMNSRPKPKRTEETKEKHRQYMLNGGAIKALRGVKNPSKPEVQLREMVKELYTDCEFQYPVLNFSLDVAIPEHKIAIEYDGYYHFDCEKNIKYHKKREEKIEQEGWKFIRYNIFQKFPSLDKVKEDIKNKLIESN